LDWRPSASIEVLRLRAHLLARARDFFAERGVLEVETPLIAAGAALDPHIESLSTRYAVGGGPRRRLYLQSSPEFAMKRLLAAHAVSIYQICKAFRDSERGSLHHPEFTLIEWYRPGWDHHTLMDEVADLLGRLLGARPVRRTTYREAFLEVVGMDPLRASDELLGQAARRAGLSSASALARRDDCLDFLFAGQVQPALAREGVVFVHDFPACQAALARMRADSPPVAERFEAFVDGVEVANGYHELADPGEQKRRFEADRRERLRLGRARPPADGRLLAALSAGLPDCAGVAVGFDRLVMVASGCRRIDEVLAFPVERA
jgi:lysyl-tRNA synthetase class 2